MDEAVERRCTNCGAAEVDVFCSRCGEKQPDHHDYAVSHFAHHTFHELVHLDSKLFTTLKLLATKPGFLTAEYFAGRKTRYISPLRLFLTLFALHLIAYTVYKPVALYSMEGIAKVGNAGPVEEVMNRIAVKKKADVSVVREQVNHRWARNLSLLQLLNILLMGVVLKVLYRRRYYVEHLVFAAHYFSFSYILALLVWPLFVIFGIQNVRFASIPLMIVALIAYLFLGMRRFYGTEKRRAAWKAVLGYAGTYVITFIIMTLSIGVAIAQTLIG